MGSEVTYCINPTEIDETAAHAGVQEVARSLKAPWVNVSEWGLPSCDHNADNALWLQEGATLLVDG